MKPDEPTRHRLFWLVCIPFRAGYAALALLLGIHGLKTLLRIQAAVAAVQVLGFLNSLGKDVGGFGGAAWWARLRPFHTAVYSAFVAAASFGVWWAGFFLVADVAAGAFAWHLVRPEYVSVKRAPAALPMLGL